VRGMTNAKRKRSVSFGREGLAHRPRARLSVIKRVYLGGLPKEERELSTGSGNASPLNRHLIGMKEGVIGRAGNGG